MHYAFPQLFDILDKNNPLRKWLRKGKMYARGESNPNRRNRNPIFYPLNYGRIRFRMVQI